MVPAISASSTSTSPLNTPPWLIESSVAYILVASTVPSTTTRSACSAVPWRLMPRPTTRVRRSPGAAAGRAAVGASAGGRGIAGMAVEALGADVLPGAGVWPNGERAMEGTSPNAGRKDGRPALPTGAALVAAPRSDDAGGGAGNSVDAVGDPGSSALPCLNTKTPVRCEPARIGPFETRPSIRRAAGSQPGVSPPSQTSFLGTTPSKRSSPGLFGRVRQVA